MFSVKEKLADKVADMPWVIIIAVEVKQENQTRKEEKNLEQVGFCQWIKYPWLQLLLLA